MQDKITIADAPDCLNTNDKAMWVLGYQAALAARSTCLHQIQVPSAADQAAWHAGLDEGRAQAAPAAVAVPANLPTGDEIRAIARSVSTSSSDSPSSSEYVMAGYRAALAATPAHHAPDAKRLIDEAKAHASKASRLTRVLLNEPTGTLADTDIAIWIEHAQQLLNTLAATPAAAPVVLPEPMHREWRFAFQKAIDTMAIEADVRPGEEDQRQMRRAIAILRALLATATGLPAQAVEPSDAELIALNAGECFFSESPSKYPELGHGTQYHGGAPGVIGFARAALALRADPAAYSQKFQQRIQPWMMACFGAEISADRIERNHRFLEEALELVQSCGCTASEAHQLVDYVYGRPWGEPAQEAGGVMVTLAALCLANGLDMHACGETELARIWTKVEAIRAKQAAKPKHSPLPEHAPQAQADARDARDFWGVIAPCGEGVFFSKEADARWTQTGEGTGSDGFGVPTIGEAFRESYEDDKLELVRVHIAAIAAAKGE